MKTANSTLIFRGALALLVLVVVACSSDEEAAPRQEAPAVSDTPILDVTSSAFGRGAAIPAKYTCDGDNVSPPIAWSAVPDGTRSIALIHDDPDAPAGTWIHWVLYGVPPDTTQLAEDLPAQDTLDDGSIQGTNDFGDRKYGGPCPPAGTHRYFFKVYALDTELGLAPGAAKSELLAAYRRPRTGLGRADRDVPAPVEAGSREQSVLAQSCHSEAWRGI